MNYVVTYVTENYKPLIPHWERGWRNMGYSPIVLEEYKDERLTKHFLKYPTLNSKYYEIQCYLRWFSIYENYPANEEAITCVDIDLFNYSFFYSGDVNMCMDTFFVYLTKNKLREWLDILLNFDYSNMNHVSDMVILQKTRALSLIPHKYTQEVTIETYSSFIEVTTEFGRLYHVQGLVKQLLYGVYHTTAADLLGE